MHAVQDSAVNKQDILKNITDTNARITQNSIVHCSELSCNQVLTPHEKKKIFQGTEIITSMRFSHTADCHVGGHRDPRLKALTELAFQRYVDGSIEDHVDFTIIAGDLFNTAIPGIDTLKFVVTQLGRLKANNIPVYAIPGSHDFSPSGKTMLDVLDEAGLLRNVCRGEVTEDGKLKLSFTIDKKSGAKLTGVIGKRGMLDRQIYEELDRSIEQEPGTKIFLFHTSITELKPDQLEQMESYPVSFLPKNFAYYAGGHVHIVERYDKEEEGYKNVIYPGPLFPNSFSELEKLQHGSYYLYDNGKITRKELPLKKVLSISVDVDKKSAQDANKELQDSVHMQNVQSNDRIVLLRIQGTLKDGSPSDIDVREAVRVLEEHGAYIVLRNTTRLTSTEFVGVQLKCDEPSRIEETLLAEHADQLKIDGADGQTLARLLLSTLSREQHDGEKTYEYQDRIAKEALQLFDTQTKQNTISAASRKSNSQ